MCLILLSSPSEATSNNDVVTALRQNPYFSMSAGSKIFLRRLQKAPWPFLDVSESSFEELIRKLNGRIPEDYEVDWSIYRTRRKAAILSLVGSSGHFFHEGSHIVLVATIRDPSNRMVGFFATTFLHTLDHAREAYIDYVVAPNGDGLGREILAFLRREFSQTFALRSLYAELEWAGREYWARPEFGFRPSPLQPTVMYGGRRVSFEVLMVFNFAGFMRAHGIIDRDLCLRQEDGSEIPFDISQTNSPSMLRCIRRRDGQRVLVGVLKSPSHIQPRRLHFGHAFMVSDYHPRKDQLIRVRMGGIDYSDTAMPPWFGVTDPCEEFLQ